MTKTKNDTTAVTRSIMVASENKEKVKNTVEVPKHKPLLNPSQKDLKEAGLVGKKATAKKPAKTPAPANAEDKNIKVATTAEAKKEFEEAVKAKKEETVVSMSTDAFSKEILSEFQKRTKAIKSAIGKIDTSFESIAFNLHWINTKQAYKVEGYPTIIEYAAEAFGYQKTTCYSLIAVVDRFAKRNEKGEMLESFEERVKGFSVSKLSLMVNLTDSEIESLKPTMSVRDIKKYVKGLEGKALPALSEGDGEPDEESGEPDEENIVDSTATVISNTLIKCKGKADYDKKIDKMDEYILRLFKQHPDAVIEVSYSLPADKEEKV